MSLTSHLRRKSSPIRRFLAGSISDSATRAFVQRINDEAGQAARQAGGLVHIAGTEPMLAGSAFDFGFRHWLQPFTLEAPPRVALQGARNAVVAGWPMALRALAAILRALPTADAEQQARCFVALALIERFYRALGAVTAAEKPDAGDDAARSLLRDPPARHSEFMRRMPDATVRDVAALLERVDTRWADLRTQPYVGNPTFALSAAVGGADADWVLGGVLYECKVSYQARPVERKHLLQLLGYLLLDSDDALSLCGAGLLLPRQGYRVQWEADEFLRNLGVRSSLAALRTEFAAVVAALPQPVRTVEEVVDTDPETGRTRRRITVRVTFRQPEE